MRIAGASVVFSGSFPYFSARCTSAAGRPGMPADHGPFSARSRLKSPFFSQVLRGRRRRGRGLARIDEDVLAALGVVQQEEAAAAEAGTDRLDHRQRRRHRDRGIEGVAALAQDLAGRPRWPAHARMRSPRRADASRDVRLALCRIAGAKRRQQSDSGRSTADREQRDDAPAQPCDVVRPLRRRRSRCDHRSLLLLQPAQLGQQLLVAFRECRIGVDAFDRADHHALRFVEMADAFGAARGIDHVDRFALRDRLVGQAGSQTSQLTQSSLIFSDMATAARSPRMRAHRCRPHGVALHFASTKT